METQEDGIIRGSNCFKCCLEEIPMMNPELRLPQQGTMSPHVCPHAVCCFPETPVSMWQYAVLYVCLKGKSVQVSTCLCVRPSFTGRGENHRCIDHWTSSQKLPLLWHEEVVYTPACLFLFLSRTDTSRETHTHCVHGQPCAADPYAWYAGLLWKSMDLPPNNWDTDFTILILQLRHNQHSPSLTLVADKHIESLWCPPWLWFQKDTSSGTGEWGISGLGWHW